MAPAISSADTDGKQKSSKHGLYQTRTSSLKTAGYIGLQDLSQLRDVYKCQAWQDFYSGYVSEKQTNNFGAPGALQTLYDHVETYKGSKKFGQPEPVKDDGWGSRDFYAHSIMQVLGMASTLPVAPTFGPLDGEVQLEAYNRAWQLLAHYAYIINGKRDDRLLGGNFTNAPAVKPRFMMPPSSSDASVQPNYIQYEFQCVWVNKTTMEKQYPGVEMPLSPFTILDPRVYDDREVRDYIRCALACPLLGFDIRSFKIEYNDKEYNSREDWHVVQDLLRNATTKEELDKFEIYVSLKSVADPDADIFELPIPAAQETLSVPPDDAAQGEEDETAATPSENADAESEDGSVMETGAYVVLSSDDSS
ncbi:hypothetical protein PV11_00966 [Exophiala sideris]|uniref:Uncharacterized protein n=1 Tax=Exophiala sideris TaxID=1016849 RepID=A0A0D1YUM8_9EURO|nr:hypothetical protein PV11_00966 [Exophiala sideris]